MTMIKANTISTIGYGYVAAPISKSKVKELIKDLEKRLEEEK